ncbi:MAG: hypothetical protein CL677_01560 [Bdellovibrionaceae bacterium]|nr:hypothetical protein [Pseudobdellovibrionaceae bacterium]|tara:strand:- start:40196 stop:40777 length:582 start_codon:yes stop_codon:yes gene_type:complete
MRNLFFTAVVLTLTPATFAGYTFWQGSDLPNVVIPAENEVRRGPASFNKPNEDNPSSSEARTTPDDTSAGPEQAQESSSNEKEDNGSEPAAQASPNTQAANEPPNSEAGNREVEADDGSRTADGNEKSQVQGTLEQISALNTNNVTDFNPTPDHVGYYDLDRPTNPNNDPNVEAERLLGSSAPTTSATGTSDQ